MNTREFEMDLREINEMRGKVDLEFRHEYDEDRCKQKMKKLKEMSDNFKEKHGVKPPGFCQTDFLEHPLNRDFLGDDQC